MSSIRQLETAGAVRLGDLVESFDELQVVLRCCEQLVELVPGQDSDNEAGAASGNGADAEQTEVASDAADPVLVEALWTTALLSYGRCFSSQDRDAVFTEDDLREVQPEGDVLGWHQVLLRLRDHYGQSAGSPREQIQVGIAQEEDSGGPAGVAVTSQPQPTVDDVTVRQLGAIAYSLARLLDERIKTQQESVFNEMKDASPADLEELERIEVASPTDTS